jgi:hypothetical protein
VWRAALAYLAVTTPWLVYATVAYGSPIPQSAVSKFQYHSVLRYLDHLGLHPVGGLLPGTAGAVVAWVAVGAGALVAVRRDRRFALVFGYGLAHFGAYLLLRPHVAHRWHLYPLVLYATVFAMIALLAATRARWPVAVVAGLAIGGRLLYSAVDTVHHATHHPTNYWSGERDATYREVAAYLREHAGPDDAVASWEVGTIAYWSDRPMHDWGGLVTREPLRYEVGLEVPYTYIVVDRKFAHWRPEDRLAVKTIRRPFRVQMFDLGKNKRPARAP